jgi:hypothetical protein
MVGNAAEWVDEHRVDITGQIVEEALDDQRTVRRQEFSLLRNYAFMGGSFLDPGRLMGMVFARTYADPAISRPPVGIRCATSLSGDEAPPTGMVALGPFEQARNGPPQLAYVEPLRGLGQEEAARVLGQTLELLLATRRNASPNDFFLDLRPVSEQAYQDFIRRTRGRPGRWSHPRQPREKTSHAVGITQGAPDDAIDYVDWWDAYAYCSWRGMRLPSRVELEIAYSGGTSSLYPWGDAYEPRRLLEYESPYAVEGLVARFSEWTADYHRSLLVQGDKPRIIRGGILDSEATQKLFSMSAFMGYADAGDASSAFRCASDKRTSIIERFAARVRSLPLNDPEFAAD